MFGDAWLTLRQAQDALRTGRLEEAGRLLAVAGTQGHRKAGELLGQLARALAERGERRLAENDPDAAWADLAAAEELGVAEPALDRLRVALTRLGLAAVRAQLEAGAPDRAVGTVERLRDRQVRRPELKPLEEAARDWLLARELADRGEFALARQAAARVAGRLTPPPPAVAGFVRELDERGEAHGRLLVQLHSALDGREWREVVRLGEALLAAAPQSQEARKARARAWQVLEPPTSPAPLTVAGRGEAERPAVTVPPPLTQFRLWVDGVGGYVVCLGPAVTLGQAGPGATADVLVQGPLSRRHLTIRRQEEAYLAESDRPMSVGGRSLPRTVLADGDELTLGPVRLRFRLPVPASNTAALQVTSGHRLPAGLDGALLMAETLVIGPGAQSHVRAEDLEGKVVLYRQGGGLGVNWSAEFAVDGRPHRGRAAVPFGSRVSGPGLSFAVEVKG
jgi:hypothetical protein